MQDNVEITVGQIHYNARTTQDPCNVQTCYNIATDKKKHEQERSLSILCATASEVAVLFD